jgi:hypothetical protein
MERKAIGEWQYQPSFASVLGLFFAPAIEFTALIENNSEAKIITKTISHDG